MTATAVTSGKSAASFGTFHWLAPELATQPPITNLSEEEPRRADFLSDVYSLGVVLWEIGTRRLPTESELQLEVSPSFSFQLCESYGEYGFTQR